MGRRIRITAVRKKEPDIHLYVLALITLARQLQEEDERRAAEAGEEAPAEEARP